MRKTVKFRLDPAHLPPLTVKQKAELAALAAMSDSQIDKSDIASLSRARCDKAVRGQFYKPVKMSATVRVDADVLAWLRGQGKGYAYQRHSARRQSQGITQIP
jgi:uncharacterized protein (DUF4415 family)